MREGEVVRVRGSQSRIGIVIRVGVCNHYTIMWCDGSIAENVSGKWIQYVAG